MGWVKANHNCPLDGPTGWSPMAHVNGDTSSKPDWSSPDATTPAAADANVGKSTQWAGDDGMWHGNEGNWNNGQWSGKK